MGRCSYTWEEQDEDKFQSFGRQCPRETWEGSDEYCIFHDPSPDKDSSLFREELERQVRSETDKSNFIGYFFPEKWDFSRQEFKDKANFINATFHKEVSFWNATFLGDANFEGAIA